MLNPTNNTLKLIIKSKLIKSKCARVNLTSSAWGYKRVEKTRSALKQLDKSKYCRKLIHATLLHEYSDSEQVRLATMRRLLL